MDPITQGVLGAAAAMSFSKKDDLKLAFKCGVWGGIAADIDILFKVFFTPLTALSLHRHFTHSIFFIPIGGLLVALFVWMILRQKNDLKLVYKFSTIGYATHGVLDACTSYGTNLYWPVLNERIAWDLITIIDPIFTLILIFFVALSIIQKSYKLSIAGLVLACLYLFYGFIQHERAEKEIYNLAQTRGHKIERIKLNPRMAKSLTAWRSVYKSGSTYFIDEIKLNFENKNQITEGISIPYIDSETVFPGIPKDSVLQNELKIFSHFAQGFIGQKPNDPFFIGDIRYGLQNNSEFIWGIKVDPNKPDEYLNFSH